MILTTMKRDILADVTHSWDWCSICGPHVRCGRCGNNCCNGGHGVECPDKCASAYALQDKGVPEDSPYFGRPLPRMEEW